MKKAKVESLTQHPHFEMLDWNESEIVKTLLYFDIFSFPLSADEIYENCSYPFEKNDCSHLLKGLVERGYISNHDNQYFINGNEGWIKRKQTGVKLAVKYLRRSEWMSLLISQFPFVRGLGISGSLSKGYADDNSDVDYFVITKKDRLWLSRTLIILFKKIFLLNSRKWLCPNYFVDEDHLRIPDENPYTATEIVYLRPAYNIDAFCRFWDENQWVRKYKPNFKMRGRQAKVPNSNSLVKRIGEWMLGGKFGDWLDDLCFKLTYSFWKRKFNNYEEEEFLHAFRSDKTVSKHHPQNFQKKVLKELEKRERAFERRFHIKLTKSG